ncbi:MAG: two-component sensor histidine kinase [Candidatus Chloroheliales bacterium]|nr:MAG: two-component sensor histidine kinase [Chloroflexota bacterium]
MRLTLWYVLLLGVIMAGFSLALYFSLAHSLYQQVDDELALAAGQAASELNSEGSQFSLASVGDDGALGQLVQRGLLLRLLDSNGKVLTARGPYQSIAVPTDAISAAQHGQSVYSKAADPTSGTDVRFYTMPHLVKGQPAGAIQLGLTLGPASSTLNELLFILAITIPTTLLVAALFGLFLASRALKPIDRITRAAASIQASDLNRRLALGLPDDETGRLAHTFDAMLARLDDAFRRQQQFTADASHELRTPLTIIKGEIDVALLRPRPPAEYAATLRDVGDEVDRLTRMVEDLLLLARADSSSPLLTREQLDLSDLLNTVAAQAAPLAAAKRQCVELGLTPGLMLMGDRDKLARLFLNLLDNAIKFTPEGGQIGVREFAAEGGIVVEVADSGPGIEASHLAHLFDRFYRVDSARSRQEGGSGLGLAIAHWIAVAHGGHIEVQSEAGQGSTFRVWLPGCES